MFSTDCATNANKRCPPRRDLNLAAYPEVYKENPPPLICFGLEYEQLAPNGLTFTSSEAFDPNDDGLLTREVKVELEVEVHKETDPDHVRLLVINDGVLAFALPD